MLSPFHLTSQFGSLFLDVDVLVGREENCNLVSLRSSAFGGSGQRAE